MAVGTVSGVNLDDNWQLISSVTASGTSITFNSFSGYKHLWLVGKSLTKAANDFVRIRPNGDSTIGSYAGPWSAGQNSAFLSNGSGGASAAQAISFKIYNVDQAIPHKVEGATHEGVSYQEAQAYVNPVAITSLVVSNNSDTAYTGGTFYLYGIPA